MAFRPSVRFGVSRPPVPRVRRPRAPCRARGARTRPQIRKRTIVDTYVPAPGPWAPARLTLYYADPDPRRSPRYRRNETAQEAHARSLSRANPHACPARPVPVAPLFRHLKRVACASTPPTPCTASSVRHLGAAMDSTDTASRRLVRDASSTRKVFTNAHLLSSTIHPGTSATHAVGKECCCERLAGRWHRCEAVTKGITKARNGRFE